MRDQGDQPQPAEQRETIDPKKLGFDDLRAAHERAEKTVLEHDDGLETVTGHRAFVVEDSRGGWAIQNIGELPGGSNFISQRTGQPRNSYHTKEEAMEALRSAAGQLGLEITTE